MKKTLLFLMLSIPVAAQTCIPYQNIGNRIVVNVTVNGQGPYAFLLDTGSQRTMIDSILATAYHLPNEGDTAVIGVGGSRSATSYTKASVGLNGQTDTVRAVVYDFSATKGVGTRVYGIIGMDFVNRHRLTIDGLHTCLILF